MGEQRALTRGDRIEHIRLALAAPVGRFVSLSRFGAMVAGEEGRAKAYDQSTTARWEDTSAPDVPAIEAMASLAQKHGIGYATRVWIAFGDEGVAEAKAAPPAPVIQPREPARRIVGRDPLTPAARSAKRVAAKTKKDRPRRRAGNQ